MSHPERLSTGIERLDERLGGGLLPGTLTAVVGSTGIGKTQLGLQFAAAGLKQEGRRGILFDLSARGDSQNHAPYARRMFGWELSEAPRPERLDLDGFFHADRGPGDYLHVFERRGRRVTRGDLDPDEWRNWQAELTRRLTASIAFFYGNFIRGVRRAVVDGIEPAERPSESIQIELFEYVYHQILRKDPEWVARDLFRQDFRRHAAEAAAHRYDPGRVACVLLLTSHETTLDGLVERPLDEGDVLAGANTLIYLGKIREGTRFRRALYVAKHRGSPCPDEILPYRIDERGLHLE
jgi:KaiC/GvpD/RAD55 family RecA-like ATPase